jgi:hypothetical protein
MWFPKLLCRSQASEIATFRPKWKVPHWKSVNTSPFVGSNPENVWNLILDECIDLWATVEPSVTRPISRLFGHVGLHSIVDERIGDNALIET